MKIAILILASLLCGYFAITTSNPALWVIASAFILFSISLIIQKLRLLAVAKTLVDDLYAGRNPTARIEDITPGLFGRVVSYLGWIALVSGAAWAARAWLGS